MNALVKIALVSLFTVGISSAACTFDLRDRNLAQPIKDIVSKAITDHKEGELPDFIKNIYIEMVDHNNYTLNGLPELKKVANFVSAYYLAHLNPFPSKPA